MNIFQHVYSWLFGKGSSQATYDFYMPAERLIYRYFNGRQVVHADPLVLYRKIMDKGPDLAVDIQVANSPSKDAVLAHSKVLEKVREIFDLPVTDPFAMDKGGLSEVEHFHLLDHFMGYADNVKKNSSRFVISAKPLAAASPVTSDASPPISSSSDSGCTVTDQPTETPTPSALESASL